MKLLTDPGHVQEPTNAYCKGLHYPSRSIMISTSASSPATIIQQRNPRLSEENRNRLLPTISHLSDLMWMAWNTVSSNPKELRYVAIDKIRDDDTLAVMDYLFLRDKKDNRNIPWPGLEYRGDSEEGKALLATPNGRATAWLLTNHAQKLKGSGELKVNIFSVFGEYCMLWDLDSQSPRGNSKRGAHIDRHVIRRLPHAALDRPDHHKRENDVAHGEVSLETRHHRSLAPDVKPLDPYLLPSNRSLTKRAISFENAVCAGQDRLRLIQSANDGKEPPAKEYPRSDLGNGWNGMMGNAGIKDWWVKYFDKELGPGKLPPSNSFIKLDQIRQFRNADGVVMEVSWFHELCRNSC